MPSLPFRVKLPPRRPQDNSAFDIPRPIRHNPGMQDDISPPAAPVEWYEPPRLGIIHLLAWVTIAAMLMKFDLAVGSPQIGRPNHSESFNLAVKLIDAANSILSAACLTGGAVFWCDRFRRKPGRIQPGHWIVAINACLFVMELALRPLEASLPNGGEPGESRIIVIFLVFLAAVVPVCLAFFFAAYRLPEPRRWKCALALQGLEYLGYSLTLIMNLLLFRKFFEPALSPSSQIYAYVNRLTDGLDYLGLIIAAYLVLICAIDFWKRRRRDWLHWLGAASPIIATLLYILGKVAIALLTAPSQWQLGAFCII